MTGLGAVLSSMQEGHSIQCSLLVTRGATAKEALALDILHRFGSARFLVKYQHSTKFLNMLYS